MKKILSIACLITCAFTAMAQQSFMADKNVAVFYPANYQSEAHSPSMIFIHDLAPVGQVSPSWQIKPVYSQTDSLSIVTIAIGKDDDLYGTGEVIGDLRRNDKEVLLWNKDNYGYMGNHGKNLYQSHPWVLGLRKDGTAYGVIADNSWKSTITTHGEIRIESVGPAFRVIVIEGQSSKEVLTKLGELTGTMEMPPLWALGYQQCRYSYYPDTRVKEIVDSMRISQVPCDVVWMDIDYMDQFKVFTFSPKDFPTPEELQDYVHSKKMKTVYMIDPGVKVEEGYFVYDQAKAYDFFVKDKNGNDFTGRVWPGDCNFPDYTRTEVRSWWSGLTRDFMRRGADGLWNDMNDPSVFGGVEGTMDESAVHLAGEAHYEFDSHLRYHNLYGTYMMRASRDGSLLANPQKRPFVLSRSNFLGGQRYGATWTGDNMSTWNHFQMSIPMTLNLGLSGQPFNGPDMCGFGADVDIELFKHWVSTGVYFPFARNHAAKGSVNQEPWAFGPEALDVYRRAVNRRYILMPYIYTLFREASTTGMPVMRPLFMADEKNLALRAEQQVYMLGDDLTIIPRWAKNPALPEGDWDIIAFDGEAADSYQAFVALRSGAALPMANLVQSTEDYSVEDLTILINPAADGSACGTLYEDAGDGFNYRYGDYAVSTIKACTDAKGKKITVTIEQTDGKRASEVKRIRVGIVTDGKVTYSPWTEGNTVTMKTVADKQLSLDAEKLDWNDIDIDAQDSLQRKLRRQVEKMKKDNQAFEW